MWLAARCGAVQCESGGRGSWGCDRGGDEGVGESVGVSQSVLRSSV